MINAYHEMSEAWKLNDKIPELRTLVFVVAIEKIANCYITLGIFP